MTARRLTKTRLLVLILIALAGAAGVWQWWQGQQDTLPEGLVFGNGRIESDQVDVAAKSAGRVREVLVREGGLVSPGQVLAHIDATELQAQRAKYAADLAAEQASMLEAQATVAQRQAELALKEANLRRALAVFESGGISEQTRDEAQSERDTAVAILDAAARNVTARERSIDAVQALIDQVDAQIADTALVSPVTGRVLYRLANPGEVVGAGGKVLTLVDLSEIYMEIYLPLQEAMRVPLGSQARIQFDGVDFAVPARVSFVSPDAQFTPKQVETRSERDKLVFRVKLRIPPSLVERHIDMVKTGARGVGYVRLDPNPPEWPDFLQQRFEGDPLDAED
ncbi:HlyD family efflux transporter periplasmic adaptor subunit [Azoarcus communis]|uniref:HlyD family secretion protein n=1 Tax=Parazoarcus communis TaxID=41977 RepID=UPI001459B587|nr:HlyD family efflux transporter periplasmic adaptor subunit [Parazoarcus communis]NMG49062.1 HlyD family efflux transporter periplasmic adaptor subunit [Parazoarcus communis]